jgi:hypothetical protein
VLLIDDSGPVSGAWEVLEIRLFEQRQVSPSAFSMERATGGLP